MRSLSRFLGLAALVAFGANCGGGDDGGPDGPTPGELTIELTTPNTDDGAIKLTISGPEALTSITSDSPDIRVFRTGALGASNTVVITGTLTDGPVLRIGVADTRDDEDYTATVVSVASTGYAVRAVTGYEFAVVK
jgi:hypothetical protein